MDEQRKYAILFAATILAARKLNEIGSSHAQRGSVPSLTQSTMPSASSRRLMSGVLRNAPNLSVSLVMALKFLKDSLHTATCLRGQG